MNFTVYVLINNSEFYCVRSQKPFYSRKHHLQKQPVFPSEGLLLMSIAKPLYEENISASLSWACHVTCPAAVVRDFSQQSLLICINRSIACLSFIVTSDLMPKSLLTEFVVCFSWAKLIGPFGKWTLDLTRFMKPFSSTELSVKCL